MSDEEAPCGHPDHDHEAHLKAMIVESLAKVSSCTLDISDEAEKGNWIRCHAMMRKLIEEAMMPMVDGTMVLVMTKGSGEPYDAENPFPSLKRAADESQNLGE